MMKHISKLVTFDDLKTNFAIGDIIEVFNVGNDGVINISTKRQLYEFEIKPVELEYEVKIQSVDDPSDSEEVYTDRPTKAIADFLSEDLPGGEFFQKMSSDISPEKFHELLQHLAFLASTKSSNFKKLLRRATVLISRDTSPLSNFHIKEFDKLVKEFKEKGWKVKENSDTHGRPTLSVDISGIYTAEVSIEGILYHCVFSVKGHPEVEYQSLTDDPIEEAKKWFRSEEVEAAFEIAKDLELEREKALKEEELSTAPTQHPDSKEITETVPPPTKKSRVRSTWKPEE